LNEHEIFISRIRDKILASERGYMITNTGFLSLTERSQAAVVCREHGARHAFWGGFADAERTVLFILPDYIDDSTPFLPSEEDEPLCLFSCRTKAGARALSHRDYLGSLLALGVERSVIGDILVYENGADIIIMKSIADYLLANYEKAGTTPLKTEILPITSLIPPEVKTQTVRESVASLRLDNMLAAVFPISRSAALEAIAKGLVFVDDTQATKPDAHIKEGAKIVLRGHGKVYFREIAGETKKGRIAVLFEKYI
jgi:RNA-binding protein YlmH